MNIMRFNFDDLQDFRQPVMAAEMEDIAPEAVEEEAPPPPPTFSQDELDLAKKSEYQRGHADGLKDGRAQAEDDDNQRNQAIDSALQTIIGQVSALEGQFKALLKAQTEELSQLILMIGKKVAGDAIATAPEAGIVEMVSECLPIVMHQPKIQLIVHSSLSDTMNKRMKAMIAHLGLECGVTVSGDDELDISECRLEWKDGAAERDMAAIWSQIEEKLSTIDFTQAVDATKAEEAVAETAPDITETAPEAADAAPTEAAEAVEAAPENEEIINEDINNNINKGESDE